MSEVEVNRVLVFDKVKEKQLNLKEASKFLKLSYVQTKRIWSRYQKEGEKGLISKKRGAKSNRAISKERRNLIVQIIIENYQCCKPLFISEKLLERHNMKYSSEFVRQLMIEHHLWVPKRKKIILHQRRMRRNCEGELIQIDASIHAWFEDRGPKSCLHLLVDDATSKIFGGYFALEETTEGYFRACLPYFEKYGRPLSLYSDKRSTFVVNKGADLRETQFSRAMKELDINMITAHSPQAKGRIERTFGTLQERLIWEMRIRNISTLEEANAFLPSFLEAYNNKFSKQPSSPFNAHRPLNNNLALEYILCSKEKRKVSKSLELQYEKEIYQLFPPKGIEKELKSSEVTVIKTLEGEILFIYKNIFIKYSLYKEMPYRDTLNIEILLKNWKKTRGSKSVQPGHPWKKKIRSSY